MTQNYRCTVPDVEHEGDIEPYLTAIRSAGGTILETRWSGEDGDDAIFRFAAEPDLLENIKININGLL